MAQRSRLHFAGKMTAPMALTFVLYLTGITFAQRFPLLQSYTGLDFFDESFDFYSGYDPTFGYVHYVDLPTAEQHNMVNLANVSATGIARWGVETVDVLDPNANLGRMSIRLQSVATYMHGLFILDVAHIPGNICGVWPAFWMVGTGVWPTTGEIDIIETTNNGPNNIMSLHSALSPNCTIARINQKGTLLSNDCAYADSYTGCAVSAPTSGTALNAAGGGVYAMLWTSEGIQMWSFARNVVPPSLRGEAADIQPDLAEFGMPTANFQGSCSFDTHFAPQQIIFNTDFCGSNAGQTFQMDGCQTEAAQSWDSCNIYVATNPGAFTEAYWEVNFLNIYDVSPNVAAPIPAPVTPVTPVTQLASSASATWPASWTVPAPYSPSISVSLPTPLARANKRSLPELATFDHPLDVESAANTPGGASKLPVEPMHQDLDFGVDVLDVLPNARPVPQTAHTEHSALSFDVPTPGFPSPTYWYRDPAPVDRLEPAKPNTLDHEPEPASAVDTPGGTKELANELDLGADLLGARSPPNARPVPQTAHTEHSALSFDIPTPGFPSPTYWYRDLPVDVAPAAAEVTDSVASTEQYYDPEPGARLARDADRADSGMVEGIDSAASGYGQQVGGVLAAAVCVVAALLL